MTHEKLSMKKYILETPQLMTDNLANSEALTRPLVELYLQRERSSLWMVACGSSYNAVHCARHLMRSMLGIDVRVITPFTFNHYEHDMTQGDLVVCVSQSGYSTNTIESLRLCRELGVQAVGLTGNIHSDFEQEADVVVDFGLQEEKLDFVTKGVVALIEFLILFALHTAQRQGRLTNQELAAFKEQISLCVQNYQYIIDHFDQYFEDNKKKLLSMERVYLMGAGASYGTALEGAVKIGETVHIVAVGYELEEMIHGPQIQLTPNYNFIFLDPQDATSERIQKAYTAAGRMTDRVFILTNNRKIVGPGVMRVPHMIPQELSPLYMLAFVQLLSYTVAETNSTWKQHPLMRDFKAVLSGKSDAYQAYDCT